MEKKVLSPIYVLFLTVLLLLSIFQAIRASVDPDNFPRLDDYYQYECDDEEDMINKATTGVIDSAIDVRNPDNVYMMNTTYGWTTTTTAGYSPHITNINCRDVYPDTAGEMMDYHGRQPGDSNFPLNVSAFRFAIKILWSRPKMDEWVSEVFDWTEQPLMTCVTPAHGKWYNLGLDAKLETYNTTKALQVLNTAGFYNDSAHTGQTDGEWWNTNPAIGPLVELRTLYVMCYLGAITKLSRISQRQYQSLADFFNIHKTYVVDESLSWTFDKLLYATFWDRTFDMSSHGWVLGKNPDYIYDFYHPSMDYPGSYNAPGWVPDDPLIADKMFALKYWRWPNGTYITDKQKMIDICWELQEDIYYASPVSYNYVTVQTSCYHPDLADVINTAGYGSDIWLTYMYNYYSGDLTKTAINYANPGPITSLNTGWLSSNYDHEVHDLINEGLWLVEPSNNHSDVMWGCTNWTWQPWSNPDMGVEYGRKVTFNIRPGIYWHDGTPCTAEDAAFSYQTIKKLHLADYADIESTFVYSDVVDEYTIDVYMNCTELWPVYSYAADAFKFPKSVWGYWWNRIEEVGEDQAIAEAEAWQPWQIDYDDWMFSSYGQTTNTGDLTCLVGTGPYIFLEWDRVEGICHLTANRPDAVWSGNPGYWRTGQ